VDAIAAISVTSPKASRCSRRNAIADCGTHLATKPPGRPVVVVKVGTLDDPKQYTPQMAIFTIDRQPFHQIPEGMKTFERRPR
jgi:hypothetical protein